MKRLFYFLFLIIVLITSIIAYTDVENDFSKITFWKANKIKETSTEMNHNQSDQSQTKESLKNDNLEKPDNPKNDIKKETDVKGVLVLVNKEHSLPADYIPENLVKPNIPFSFKEDLPKKLMRKEAAQAIENLFKKAKEDNFNLVGVSAYRSYHRQKQIFDYKARKLGKEVANKTSAYPGQSEHQTGLAIDISSPNMGYRLHQAFGNTPEGIWLAKNAPNFGFIIRYPNGKEEITGYVYEPWHLRYVGIKVAQEITQKNITFEERMRDFS